MGKSAKAKSTLPPKYRPDMGPCPPIRVCDPNLFPKVLPEDDGPRTRALVRKFCEELSARIAGHATGQPIDQEMLAAAFTLRTFSTLIEKASSNFKAFALAHVGAGGTFAPGDIVVEVADGRRMPPWKDEALRLAKEVADLTDQLFNPEQYTQQVLARTPVPKNSTLKLVCPNAEAVE